MNNQETIIREGEEYRILCNGRIIFEGIAESDNEAVERLDDYVLQISAVNTSNKVIKFHLVKL